MVLDATASRSASLLGPLLSPDSTNLDAEVESALALDPPHGLCRTERSAMEDYGGEKRCTKRTLVCHGHDHPLKRFAVLAAPRKPEVVRHLLAARPDIHDVRLDSDVLGALSLACIRIRMCERGRTMSAGNSFVDVVWRIWDLRRRTEPMGTGRAKEMLSSERNRTGPRVKSIEFEYPSCADYEVSLRHWNADCIGAPHKRAASGNLQNISFTGRQSAQQCTYRQRSSDECCGIRRVSLEDRGRLINTHLRSCGYIVSVFSSRVVLMGTRSSPATRRSAVSDCTVDCKYSECKAAASADDGGTRASDWMADVVRRFLCAKGLCQLSCSRAVVE